MNEDHWEVLNQNHPDDPTRVPSPRSYQHPFVAPSIPSRSSSIGSLPQSTNSPQIPPTVPVSPRSSSPFNIAPNPTPVYAPQRNLKSDDRIFRKKSPPVVSGAPALGILKALDPHQEITPSQTPQDSSEDHHVYNEPPRIDKDKKERKGFWDGMLRDRDKDRWRLDKDKDKDKDRPDRVRDRDRRDEDLGTAELTRMIGISLSTSIISDPNTPSVRLPHRDRLRGLVRRSRGMRKSLRQRTKRKGSGQGTPT